MSGGHGNSSADGGALRRPFVKVEPQLIDLDPNPVVHDEECQLAMHHAFQVDKRMPKAPRFFSSSMASFEPLASAAAKMQKWQVMGMNPSEVAEAMAAFMLHYRVEWEKKFDPLKECLKKFFHDDFGNGQWMNSPTPGY